ncbi:MAG TPA: methyltransferase domain-containing protein [Myxococcaceae bacterium]|nr:methyltransferase domain-containing protein [Myxococcaceae bacterium]
MGTETPADNVYAQEGHVEGERLRIQARTWEPEAEAMLDQIGLRPGSSCVDLGCGAMGIVGPLARRVGPAGRVIGVDKDQRLLDVAAEYLKQEGLTNVQLLNLDAYDTGLAAGTFDFVHERLVFCPAGAADLLLGEMLRLAKSGGVVAVQEPDPDSWHLHPRSEAWENLLRVTESYISMVGGDPRAGQKTFGLLRKAGLSNVKIRAAVKALQDGHPYMSMALFALRLMRDAVLDARIISEPELDRIITDVETRLRDPCSYMTTFTITQVWGVKH